MFPDSRPGTDFPLFRGGGLFVTGKGSGYNSGARLLPLGKKDRYGKPTAVLPPLAITGLCWGDYAAHSHGLTNPLLSLFVIQGSGILAAVVLALLAGAPDRRGLRKGGAPSAERWQHKNTPVPGFRETRGRGCCVEKTDSQHAKVLQQNLDA